LEEFDICWKAHKDTLANLFQYPGTEKDRLEKITISKNKIDQFGSQNLQTFKNETFPSLQINLEDPDFSKIENEFYDEYNPVPQLNQQESQLKIQMERILRLETMVSKKDNKIEVLTKNVNKLMMENRELNTTVYMNEVACEDQEIELEKKPVQD
jgi:hypothetical protein